MRPWAEEWSCPQPQEQTPSATQSSRNPGRNHEPPHDPGDSGLVTNFSPITGTCQRREATGPMIANGHDIGSGNCMTANGHDGTSGDPKSGSALVETASEPHGPGSGPKTVTGTAETARGQWGSVTSPSESALIHATANGSWSERVTRETGHATQQNASGHYVALPEDHSYVTAGTGKSESGIGPWKNPKPRESAIMDHAPSRRRILPREGQCERAQVTLESERAPLPQPPGGKKQLNHTCPQKPRPSWGSPSFPPNSERVRGDNTRANARDALRLP